MPQVTTLSHPIVVQGVNGDIAYDRFGVSSKAMVTLVKY